MDESLIEKAITPKTKAIMPVHYAGISCNMDKILEIASKHNLIVLEDAAQCIGAKHKGQPVGARGHLSAFSFHDTKNIQCGEGGMLCVNDAQFLDKAEILRDKGTNRQQFFKGRVDKYSWVDKGSSYLMSELQAAFLWDQLQHVDQVTENRSHSWRIYYEGLKELEIKELISLSKIPAGENANGHLFYILTKDPKTCINLKSFLFGKGVLAAPHYIPLHSSKAGKKYGKVGSKVINSDDIPFRLLRMPLYYGIKENEINFIIENIKEFYLKL